MPIYKVKVKWGKEMFPDVELDTDEPPVVFKAQLFALTGVQPHRQKIMLKGSTVKDEQWDGVKIKDGSMVLMMGSKDEDVPAEVPKQTKFIEDMTEEQMNSVLDLPMGIKNLGNTCYLNAVMQCLKTVPELDTAIKEYKPKVQSTTEGVGPILTNALQECFKTMDNGKTAIPFVLVNLFRTAFPRFAEQGDEGGYVQQDASECWTELVRMLQDILPAKNKVDETGAAATATGAVATAAAAASSNSKSLFDQYFTGEFTCEWKNEESEEEEAKTTNDKFQMLSCHINADVKYLQSGLQARMQEHITKKSAQLDRDALYKKSSLISRLPAYLTVEMVRFYFKEKKSVNAKVLKDVKFPMMLDVFDLCSKDLQIKLTPVREKYKQMEDRQADEEVERKRTGGKSTDIVKAPVKKLQFSFDDDNGSNNSGFYELQAVLTHQGRTSSSGHYVAWIRYKNKEWLKCDDDIVSPVTEDEILKLSGGGDWHCAYILLYGPRILEVLENVKDTSTDVKVSEAKAEKMETE